MEEVRHFVEGSFTPHAVFLPVETYALVRDSFVLTCSDVLVTDKAGRILLGKRVIEPYADRYWSFGGRIIPGESPKQACSRIMRKDLGLLISPHRFIFLEPVSCVCGIRQELPRENGSHDITLFHLLLIDKRESSSLEKGREDEYGKIKWFKPEEIIGEPDRFLAPLVYIVKEAQERFQIKE